MTANINNVEPRQLGSGFGPENQFPLFLNEPNRGLINNLSSDKIATIHDWINSQQEGKSITEVLDSRVIASIIPDILVDMSVRRLAKILPRLLADIPENAKDLFMDETLLNKLDTRFLNSLQKSLPQELPEGVTLSSLTDLLSQTSLRKMASSEKIMDKAYLLAYLIPALLDVMEDAQLEKASVEIAKRLAPKNFNAAADANYFDLQLESQVHSIDVENNGRTLTFRAKTHASQPSLAKYRGRIWTLDHTHVHPEKDGEEREYVIFDSPSQKQEVDSKKLRDPNLDIVGEIHTVYKRLPKKYAHLPQKERDAYWKYMAVGVPLKIGAFNQDFDDILKEIDQEGRLTEDKTLKVTKNFQETFVKKFDAKSVLYHSWGSLKSITYGFRSGLSFNIIPQSIDISADQYARFKELFGTLKPLSEEKVLEPIDRKAGRRQIRKI